MKIYYNPKLKPLARKLRKNSTFGEVLLWNELKKCRIRGYQFMRQKPIGEYIVDFFCSKLQLVIEIDGKTNHRHKLTKDVQRQQWLEELGLEVLRFTEMKVRNDMKSVLSTVNHWIIKKENAV